MNNDLFSPIVLIILFVIGLVITVVWIAFPFLILGKVSSLIETVEKTNDLLRKIEARIATPPHSVSDANLLNAVQKTNGLLTSLVVLAPAPQANGGEQLPETAATPRDAYFYSNDAMKTVGPVKAAKLQLLIADGTVTDETPVAREGGEWQAWRDFPELAQ